MTKTALISLVAVLVLAAVCTALVFTGTASAKTLNNGKQSDTVDVTYTVAGGWEVEITDGTIALTPGTDSTLNVEVKKAVLNDSEKLSITVESTNGYKLKHGTDELIYTVKKDATNLDNSDNKTILDNIDGTTDLSTAGKAELKVQITEEEAGHAKYVGEYTDTLTFTVTVA